MSFALGIALVIGQWISLFCLWHSINRNQKTWKRVTELCELAELAVAQASAKLTEMTELKDEMSKKLFEHRLQPFVLQVQIEEVKEYLRRKEQSALGLSEKPEIIKIVWKAERLEWEKTDA